MNDNRKSKTDVPVGYTVATPRKRVTRPLHSRREAILEQAEAFFAKVRVDPIGTSNDIENGK